MSETATFKPEELDGYVFGDVAAPEGFDPEASGFSDPSIGKHIFECRAWSPDKPAYEVKCDHDFKWDGQVYTLNQLWIRFVVPPGQPEAGAKTMDFCPLPTPGRPMPAGLANRWANLIKSLGFDLPPGQIVPSNFKLRDLEHKRCVIDIEHQTDAAGEPKYRRNGKPQVGPSFFGYSRVDASSKPSGKGAARPAPAPRPASAPQVAAPPPAPAAPAAFDL